jgi:branched-subunit amino acid aminotransferase/4-amino-4-deoxychorismate lyase
MISQVLINGEISDGRIPVTDSSVLRGDGCFEVLKAYDGRPFRLEAHLDRLEASASRLEINLPDRGDISSWITNTAQSLGDGLVRVVVTRGSSVPGGDEPTQVIVFGHEGTGVSGPVRLSPVEAPWHAAGVEWDLAGAKILSYAPNLAATRRARAEGFEDALLVTTDGRVLEGPTFSIAWVIDDVMETPTLDLGILDSITRRVVLDAALGLGIEVLEGSWVLDRLYEAVEVMALSTVREVQSVSQIGEMSFSLGPLTARLASGFEALTSQRPKPGN